MTWPKPNNMLRKTSYRKIDTKIFIVFIVVIAIAFFNAIFSSYTILRSQKTTKEIVENTAPSKDALSQLNTLIVKSQMLITNRVYLPSNTSDRKQLEFINKIEYRAVKAKLTQLMKQWEDTSFVSRVNTLFIDFEKVINYEEEIMSTLETFDDYQDPMKKFAAEDVLEREIIPRIESIGERLMIVVNRQSATAKENQAVMLSQLDTLTAVVFSIAILIVGSLFFAAFIISRTFIVPVLRVSEIIHEMNLGRLPEYKMNIPKNAVGEMLVALKSFMESVKRTSHFAGEIGKGNFDVDFTPLSEEDVHGHALLQMRNSLKSASKLDAELTWVNDGLVRLNNIMRNNADDFTLLLDKIIGMIVEYINIQQAAIFLLQNDDMEEMHIQLGAYYALNSKILNSKRYELKEGLIGEAIAGNRIIDIEKISDPFFTIDMGVAQSNSCSLMILPLATSGKVVGAITVVSMTALTPLQKTLLQKITEPVAANIFSVRANLTTSQLLEESRKQAEELALQEQELRKINMQLTHKSQELVKSEEELLHQQEELQQVNMQLQEKARLLEEKNIAIEEARQSLAFKAEQLEQSNKYKSSFLANISHELRTPLNSILILAKILADNKSGTKNKKQTEHANVIYKSGSDLLELINDILDLSKIEAGKIELHQEYFEIAALATDMQMLFSEIANDKRINFTVSMHIDADSVLYSDKMRVQQIIKNLLSNALKFTSSGGNVNLIFKAAEKATLYKNTALFSESNILAIEVEDNGIGIPFDKQSQIFEAFQQADGSTSRKYGGTGLGLAICKELAQLLNGEIQVKSTAGSGSTFTLYLPAHALKDNSHRVINSSTDFLRDDKNNLQPGDKRILIVEDDPVFAQILMTHCRNNGIKAIVAVQGDKGLEYAKLYQPDAIILDMQLPVMDGWTLLQQIRMEQSLFGVPVHVLTSADKKELSMETGATTFNKKTADNKAIGEIVQTISNDINSKSKVLIIDGKISEPDSAFAYNVDYAAWGNCFEKITSEKYKYILANNTSVNAIRQQLESETEKLDVRLMYFNDSPDECLRMIDDMDNSLSKTQQSINKVTASDTGNDIRSDLIFSAKTALLVDDDVRNVYSMTSSLEAEGMQVICALDGKEAIEILGNNPHVDIILMDIMMPQMNGCDAIREIRKQHAYEKLPIIAVTAKAMPGDREHCMNAGASDYITKPVNIDYLFSVIQMWLKK